MQEFCFVFSLSAAKQNKQTATYMTGMKDGYLCLSLHNVFLEIPCCLRDQTLYFYSFILLSIFGQPPVSLRRHDYVDRAICRFKYQTSLLEWEGASQDNTPFLCMFVAFHEWKSERQQDFVSHIYPYSVEHKMFLVSALFIVSVCYLYTAGFEINNLAIISLWLGHNWHFSVAGFESFPFSTEHSAP